jgi:hypothetical protein
VPPRHISNGDALNMHLMRYNGFGLNVGIFSNLYASTNREH